MGEVVGARLRVREEVVEEEELRVGLVVERREGERDVRGAAPPRAGGGGGGGGGGGTEQGKG